MPRFSNTVGFNQNFFQQCSNTELEAENRKLRDQNSELHERLKFKENELNQLRMKTDKDFAREVVEKEREVKILEEKCRSYVKEIANNESIGRKNESMSKQLAQSNAMFEEQYEQLQKAESQVNYVGSKNLI